jgi:predicted N-acetyltransferase YhbS
MSWTKRWASSCVPYAHIGPVAVDPHLQRKGVGSGMMRALCARLDEQSLLAYLETDKPVNVQFYRKFGFETIDETMVVGVRSWFMVRRPQHSDQNTRQR